MPAHRPKDNSYDAYEYTAHSHTYNAWDIPSAKVSLGPMQEQRLELVLLYEHHILFN